MNEIKEKPKMFEKITYINDCGIARFENNGYGIETLRSLAKMVILTIEEEMNDKILEELYKICKDSDISQVYVINETMFKEYLKDTLGKWLKEKNNE